MQPFQTVKKAWGAVRWKMLIIFVFFNITSMFLVACFSVAVVNVVIRRESVYLIEERINGIVDNRGRLTPFLLDQVQGCETPASNSPMSTSYLNAVWPGGASSITVPPRGAPSERRPGWLDTGAFAGIVVDQGNLEIRFFSTAEREGCFVTMLLGIPLSESFANEVARTAGFQISGAKLADWAI